MCIRDRTTPQEFRPSRRLGIHRPYPHHHHRLPRRRHRPRERRPAVRRGTCQLAVHPLGGDRHLRRPAHRLLRRPHRRRHPVLHQVQDLQPLVALARRHVGPHPLHHGVDDVIRDDCDYWAGVGVRIH